MTQYNPPPQYGYGQQAPPTIPPGGTYTSPIPVTSGPRRYSIFAPWVMWFSPNLWRDVGRRWGGICFFYLLLLELVTWLPIMAKVYVEYTAFQRNEAPALVNQVPQVTITNGVVSIDKPEPYTITMPTTGQTLVVIDTTGETTQPPAQSPSMLLTRSQLMVRDENGMVKTVNLSDVKSFQADSTRVSGWLDAFRSAIFPGFYPGAVIGALIIRLIETMILAGIGTAVASGMGVRLTYGGLMRLWIVVMTPFFLIDTVLGLLGVPTFCIWELVAFVGEMILLFFAIRANAPQRSIPPQYGFPMNQPFPPAG